MHYLIDKRHGSPTKRLMHGYSGATKHPLYSTWCSMKQRCSNVYHDKYQYYGERGITVCDRWLGPNGFSNFISDMGERPGGYSIDRKDNSKGYTPGNCRWATKHEQESNKRNNGLYVGVSYSIRDNNWLAELTVNGKKVLKKSYKRIEDAVNARSVAESIYLKGAQL